MQQEPEAAAAAAAPLISEGRGSAAPYGATEGRQHEVTSSVEVQFGSPFFYADRNAKKVYIDVFCLDPHPEQCVVRYCTADGQGNPARAGEHYHAQEGELIFEEHVYSQQIVIDVISDGSWSTTREFTIALHTAQGCRICPFLGQASVRLVSSDCFPSNAFHDDLEAGKRKSASMTELLSARREVSLMLDYIIWNSHIPGIRWRAFMVLVFDQLQSFYAFLLLCLEVYLIDVIFSRRPEDKVKLWLRSGPEDGKVHTALVVAFLYVLPIGILHVWDYVKVRYLSIGDIACKYLRAQLFRRFMSLNAEAHSNVSPAGVAVACLSHSRQVADGLDSMLLVVQSMGRLLALLLFMFWMNRLAAVFVIAMPCAGFLYVLVTSPRHRRAQHIFDAEGTRVADFIIETSEAHSAILGLMKGMQIGEKFEEKLGSLGSRSKTLKLNSLADTYFAKWALPISMAIYITTNVNRVFQGYLSLGRFLAALRVIFQTSLTCDLLHQRLILQFDAVRPLEEIADLINLPSVHWDRLEQSNAIRDETKAQLHLGESGAQQSSLPLARLETLRIELRNMSFFYHKRAVFKQVNISVRQGTTVAIVGKEASGKATLLRLLSGGLNPTSGLVFVPSHLRRLLLGADPIMFEGTLFENLTFGIFPKWSDLPRIVKVVKAVGIINEILIGELEHLEAHSANLQDADKDDHIDIAHLREEMEIGATDDQQPVLFHSMSGCAWKVSLPASTLAKVHLARALIANAEVLVLHRPFGAYSAEEASRLFTSLKDFVISRREAAVVGRHADYLPLTCFFTPLHVSQAREADVVWRLKDGRVDEIPPQDVTTDMVE